MWYSHKFSVTGIRYEIVVSNGTVDIIWVKGPYPGRYPDIKIFKISLLNQLRSEENVIGDNGYTHARVVTSKNCNAESFHVHSRLRSRLDNVNKSLKNFECIRRKFRHQVSLHGAAFMSFLKLQQC